MDGTRGMMTSNERPWPTFHEEIISILAASGDGWMTTTQISEQVRSRGVYKKRDGTRDVTPFQVHGRTKNYPQPLRTRRESRPSSALRDIAEARGKGHGRAASLDSSVSLHLGLESRARSRLATVGRASGR
jgi:hypothetical protein